MRWRIVERWFVFLAFLSFIIYIELFIFSRLNHKNGVKCTSHEHYFLILPQQEGLYLTPKSCQSKLSSETRVVRNPDTFLNSASGELRTSQTSLSVLQTEVCPWSLFNNKAKIRESSIQPRRPVRAGGVQLIERAELYSTPCCQRLRCACSSFSHRTPFTLPRRYLGSHLEGYFPAGSPEPKRWGHSLSRGKFLQLFGAMIGGFVALCFLPARRWASLVKTGPCRTAKHPDAMGDVTCPHGVEETPCRGSLRTAPTKRRRHNRGRCFHSSSPASSLIRTNSEIQAGFSHLLSLGTVS